MNKSIYDEALEKIKMAVLYDDVIELRNRLSIDGSGEIYQEDSIVLDKVLDILEKHLIYIKEE